MAHDVFDAMTGVSSCARCGITICECASCQREYRSLGMCYICHAATT